MIFAKNTEILFVKCVKDGIPNRDPLNESDARRLFSEEDGRISLSDVSIKRDVRDYIIAKYPDGGENKNNFIYCQEKRDDKDKLLTRQDLVKRVIAESNANTGKVQSDLAIASFDYRAFGVVYSVSKENFHQVGPVQFGWAHSLHPVETKFVQGTVVMPSDDNKGQGTIWTSYMLPFGVFSMPGIVNETIAKDTGFTEDDMNLLLEALWNGTLYRQARGRGIQQPLLLIAVEYVNPFYRIGYLDEKIVIKPERETWLGSNPPTTVKEIKIDVSELSTLLNKKIEDNLIRRVRYWVNDQLALESTIPGEKCGTFLDTMP